MAVETIITDLSRSDRKSTSASSYPSLVDVGLDLRYLRNAIVASEQGSLRRAAAFLGCSQSAISRRIQILERRLGFALFLRTRAGIRLTTAGESFLKDAAINIEHFDNAKAAAVAVDRKERGGLRIGVPAALSSGFLHRMLRQYLSQHGGTHVTIREGTSEENLRRMAAGQLDVFFGAQSGIADGYESVALWRESLFVGIPSNHHLARSEAVSWHDLSSETILLSRGGPGPDIHRFIVERTASLGLQPSLAIHDVAHAGLPGLVSIGYGLTVLCGSAAEAESNGITFRPLAVDETIPWAAIWSRDASNPALQQLLAIARKLALASGRMLQPGRVDSVWTRSALCLMLPISAIASALQQIPDLCV